MSSAPKRSGVSVFHWLLPSKYIRIPAGARLPPMKIATARTTTTAGAFRETRSTTGSMRERANRDRGPASPRLHRRKVAAASGPRNRFVYSPTRSGTKSNPVARSGSVPNANRAATQPPAATDEKRGTAREERTHDAQSDGNDKQ